MTPRDDWAVAFQDLAGTLGTTDPARAPLLAPVLARVITATAFAVICAFAYLQAGMVGSAGPKMAAFLLILLAIQVFYFGRPGTRLHTPLTYGVIAAQLCLVFVPQAEFGAAWTVLPTFLAGTVLLVLPPWVAWPSAAGIIAIIARNQEALTHSGLDVAYVTAGCVGVTLEVYGLTRLAGVIARLHEARSELGRVAVARERRRFARDLHDLVGLSLATIGPRVAVAEAAVDEGDPERACAQLREVTTVARHALADIRLIAGGYRDAAGDDQPADTSTSDNRRWDSGFVEVMATGLMNAVFVGFAVAATLHLVYLTRDSAVLAASATCMTALAALQVFFVSKPGLRLEGPVRWVVILGQAVLVYLPLALFPHAWASVPGMLAGTLPLVLRPLWGWLGFAAVTASVPLLQSGPSLGGAEVVYTVGATLTTGLVTFGMTWMARAVHELRAARRELAEAAVADERLRFARDLHDLLGLGLSAITLKTELAMRLLAADPVRARVELGEIKGIARVALADVRLVAAGHPDLSLGDESRAAESVLAAAEVDVRMDLRYGELPERVRTVLATVLREGVTNVLRHSRGGHCEISVRREDPMVVLEIVNDGVVEATAARTSGRGGGSGLLNLSARVATVGGSLTALRSPEGAFRLCAQIPVPPPRTGE